ncbi:protein UsfY [Mycolicibacterium brumae]|uniref:UsfY protein n=1 Tax=Mycolicibacterium brumae TaxID=85968 RepID=A0A2G5PCX8_9MYCO|nr:protein UsfY [Mycolicibacterium brumae]MCV7191430.1 LapA family protein [Mycolicibacterium brumae]PIB75754.1 UsfY protein [Mycolicibacterium brumae]RWA16142.1 hypothetical protein MBRU_08515 [Mycolicibacterium brumae DSM 44177]UWW09462.1 LapA family protein [Mycolicibacterium brumae]
MKAPEDPVDHARTTRKHAGEAVKDNRNMPALLVLGVAVVLFAVAVAAFALGHSVAGAVAGVLALAGLIVGGLWLRTAHEQVRDIEDDWHDRHPETPQQEPTS